MTDHTAIRPTPPTSRATHELHAARVRTHEALTAAWQELLTWVDLVRQGAESRTGSVHPHDVITDPAYDHALDLFGPLNQSITAFHRLAERIEDDDHEHGHERTL